MRRAQNIFFQPHPDFQNSLIWPKKAPKLVRIIKVRIEGSIENKKNSALWIDIKPDFEPHPNPILDTKTIL